MKRNIIEICLLSIIFAFIFVFAAFIFHNLFIKPNLKYAVTFIGAFMGAFFAFLFIRISEILKELYDREKKNYNALVKLELLCNEYVNIIYDNTTTIDNFTKFARESIEKNRPFAFDNRLIEIPIDKEIPLCLSNAEFINTLFSFNIDLFRTNDDIHTFNRSYAELKDAFIKKNLNFDAYKENVINTIKRLQLLKAFLKSLDKKVKRIVAITRVLLKRKPLLIRLIQFKFNKKLFTNDFEELIIKEKEKFIEESEQVSKKSKVETDKIVNDAEKETA